MKLRIIFLLLGLFPAVFVTGQNPDKYIRQGNDLYGENKFNEAETNYLKALETDSSDIRALFNRADALYQQENYNQAGKIFNNLTKKPLSEDDQASIWHNMGNTKVESKQYKEAVDAYKKALRKNPSDMDTKYNLSYALKKLKDQQQKKKNKNQDQKQNKDKNKKNKNRQDQQKNKDNQNRDQKQDKDKQKQQKNNQDQKKKGEQKKQQPQPQKISKEDAKRMLQALKNNEKNTLKKLKKKNARGQEVETEKDW